MHQSPDRLMGKMIFETSLLEGRMAELDTRVGRLSKALKLVQGELAKAEYALQFHMDADSSVTHQSISNWVYKLNKLVEKGLAA